ncbi:glycosyltransferase [Aquifex sp.]
MRIAFYVNNLKSVSATTKIAIALEKELRKQGFAVDYIVQKEPIEVNVLGKIHILKQKNDFLRALEIKRLSQDFDFILAFMKPMSNVLALSRLVGNSKILIGSVHNNDNFLKYGKPYFLPIRFLQKYLFDRLDKIVVVSEAVKRDLGRTYWISEEKIRVIYNPIDVDEIREKASEEIEEEYQKIFEKPVLINIGRLEKQKGQWHLLKIFKILVESGEDLNLLILGDGNLRNYLKNLAKELGLEKRVFFLGFQRNPYKFLKRSKIFVFTSLWEGFGNALVEAMALGIPFVASNIEGGFREVIRKGGFYVDLNDYEGFAEKIKLLLKDEKIYIQKSQEAIQTSELFRPERIAKQYVKLFRELSRA